MRGGRSAGSGASPSQAARLDNTGTSRKKVGYYTKYKAIGAGKNIEIYEYQEPIYVNHSNSPKRKELKADEIIDILVNPEKYEKKDRSDEYRRRNALKAKNKLRRLVQANFDKVGKFLTLTFADTDKFDITSLDECHNRLEYFIKSLRKIYPHLKYIAVPEFQDKNDRGAVHYHLMLNIPFTKKKTLRKLWKYGFIKIKKVTNTSGIGAYIAKYLTKSTTDPRFKGKRTYYNSQNLIQPTVSYNASKIASILESMQNKSISPDYTSEYESDWQGKVRYSSYNLYQHSAQKENYER